MRNLAALALVAGLAAGPALAQTTVTGQPAAPDAKSSQGSGGQEALTRPNTDKATADGGQTGSIGGAKLEPGSNSFTEGQVASRLDQAGFKDAKELVKGEDGIWRGTAMRDGKPVKVGLDFKGNVALQ
jgi:protein CpxP